MSIEQRLHRAAHELREIPVDVPGFEPPAPPSHTFGRLGSVVAAGFLVAVGAVAVAASGTGMQTVPDAPIVAAPSAVAETSEVAEPDEAVVAGADVSIAFAETAFPLTPLEEVAMIESIGGDRSVADDPTASADRTADIPANAT